MGGKDKSDTGHVHVDTFTAVAEPAELAGLVEGGLVDWEDWDSHLCSPKDSWMETHMSSRRYPASH